MSHIETFDDFLSTETASAESGNETPFQFRENPKNEEETLQWLTLDIDAKLRKAESRLRTYRRYWAYYKGIHWQFNSTRNSDDEGVTQEKKPKMKVNFIYEMVEGRIAQLTENKVAIACMPQNGMDNDDVNNARACKTLLDAWADKYDMDELQEEGERVKAITGTVFQYGYYDHDAGPLHPAMEKVMDDMGRAKFPVLNDKGLKTRETFEGEIRVGEACLENLSPEECFLELERNDFKNINEFTYIKYIHRSELAAMFPKHKAIILAATCDDFRYDHESLEVYKSANYLRVCYYWHKKTKHLNEGAYIVFIPEGILEWKANPFKNGDLPLKVDYDIKVKGEIYGRSFISNIEQMQDLYNSIRSGIGRDIKVGSMPKWAVPKGAVKISSLNNEFTIMEYTGAKAPEIIQNVPISDKLLGMEDKLEKQIAQHSSLFDISRGQVPTGVTANSALRFLDEQEDRRVAPLKKKRRKRIVNSYRLLVTIMAQYYTPEDGRTAHILGKGNEYLIKSFKRADFTQIYDVRIQQSSALPDTKTGKISMIVDINTSTQTDPVFRKEQIADMLDLGNDEAYIDGITIASRAANEILDRIQNSEAVPEPEPYDNNLVHWNVFTKYLQGLAFKTTLPKPIRKIVIERITTIEGLMFQQAKKNGKYLSALMAIPEYPIFYTPEVPMQDLAMMMAQGAQGVTQQMDAKGPMQTDKIKNIPNQQGEPDATRAS